MYKVSTRYQAGASGAGQIVASSTFTNGKRKQRTIAYPHHLSGVDTHLAGVVALMEAQAPITRSFVDSIDRIVPFQWPDGRWEFLFYFQ